MSVEAADHEDLPVWDPPIFTVIQLADFERTDGVLIVYGPEIAEGRARIESDCYVDTYDVR